MEEVYKEISARLIRGMMTHDQLARYYDFLGLKGYKRCHEYEFLKDTITYRKVHRYYINNHSKLIPDMQVADPNIIPSNWQKYKREDVDMQTKRNSVENGIVTWVEWERGTKVILEENLRKLYENHMYADIEFIETILKDVDMEYKKAMRKWIELKSINYDMPSIVLSQESIHDKYKKKTEELFI